MKYVVVALLISVVVASAIPATIVSEFIAFQNKYGKFYPTQAETQKRLAVFAANVEHAAKLNAENEQTEFGITKFMDMTPEEFKNTVLMHKFKPRNQTLLNSHYERSTTMPSAPSQYDWRKHSPSVVTPVYNQGQCGSCWAFSATENVESQYALGGHTLTKLSMQQVVDCDKMDYGCGGGWTYQAYEYLIKAGGQDSYASYPYDAENGPCTFKASDVVAKLSGWSYVTQNEDESQMVDTLVSTGPLSVCVDASSWQFYSGGVYMASSCGTAIDHCVEAIGYNTGASTPYWMIRNSWGTDWGLSGYMQLEYGKDACAVAQVVTMSKVE